MFVASIKSGVDVISHLCVELFAANNIVLLPPNPVKAWLTLFPVVAVSIILATEDIEIVFATWFAIGIVISADAETGLKLSLTVVV